MIHEFEYVDEIKHPILGWFYINKLDIYYEFDANDNAIFKDLEITDFEALECQVLTKSQIRQLELFLRKYDKEKFVYEIEMNAYRPTAQDIEMRFFENN